MTGPGVLARAATIPSTVGGSSEGLWTATLDDQRRFVMRGAALAMGWHPGQQLEVNREDGALLLAVADPPPALRCGLSVRLDAKWRVQLPYGLCVLEDLRAACRLLIVGAHFARVVAVVPSHRVLATLLGPQ